MDNTETDSREIRLNFDWEVAPYEVPQPVNEAAVAIAIEGSGESSTDIILRLGYALPPTSIPQDSDEIEVQINHHGSFILSVDAAEGIRDALDDVVQEMRDRAGE